MSCYDIVYIKGNSSSGTPQQHDAINATIINLIKVYNYIIIDSEHKNLSQVVIPDAKIYIGFSRGSRYLKKLENSALKISIGGVRGSQIHLFKNNGDDILLGDISESSMKAHFIINEDDKIKIKSLIDNFLIV
jgi:hypothetical protein